MSPVLVDFSHTLPEGLLSLSRGGTTDGMGDLLKGRHFDLDESLSPCASYFRPKALADSPFLID
jgi:hypothetical protein